MSKNKTPTLSDKIFEYGIAYNKEHILVEDLKKSIKILNKRLKEIGDIYDVDGLLLEVFGSRLTEEKHGS